MFSRINTTQVGPSGRSSEELHIEHRQAKREKRRRLWRKARTGLLCFLALAFVGHLSLNIYASMQLNNELAAIRQNGDPLRFSELEPPAVPDAQNAALVYQQAKKALQLTPTEKGALHVREGSLSPQEEAVLKNALSANQKALELTRRAAAMPQCLFAVNWKGDPIRMTFPYYSDLRELAQFLAVDARIRASNGDKAGALSDVRALFGMSHHISSEPVFIGFLVSQSLNSIAHRALGRTLESISLTVPEARALEASLPHDDWAKAFHQSLLGERAYGLFAFESLGKKAAVEAKDDEGMDYMPVWTKSPLLSIAHPFIKLDEVQTLRMWKLILNSPQSQQVPSPVGFGLAQVTALNNTPSYAVLTKILFPVFSRASDYRDTAFVQANQREVALALTCFRTAKGSYPAQLAQAEKLWGKPLALDIYSQKNFLYRSNGKSFVLYSIGVNRKNDGGKNARYKGKFLGSPLTDDIVWALP
ncbi:hypothetical protein EON83_04235 [bacterium]|nr:MAG: hypothetical protein EON83_04235 [bacterium]